MEQKRLRRPKKYKPRRALKAIYYRHRKWSYRNIADEEGVTPGTIRYWIRTLCEDKSPAIKKALEQAGYSDLANTDGKGPTIGRNEKGVFLRAFLAVYPKADYQTCRIAIAPNYISDALYRITREKLKKEKQTQKAPVKPKANKQAKTASKPVKAQSIKSAKQPVSILNPYSDKPEDREHFAEYLTWWAAGERSGFVSILKAELEAENKT